MLAVHILESPLVEENVVDVHAAEEDAFLDGHNTDSDEVGVNFAVIAKRGTPDFKLQTSRNPSEVSRVESICDPTPPCVSLITHFTGSWCMILPRGGPEFMTSFVFFR